MRRLAARFSMVLLSVSLFACGGADNANPPAEGSPSPAPPAATAPSGEPAAAPSPVTEAPAAAPSPADLASPAAPDSGSPSPAASAGAPSFLTLRREGIDLVLQEQPAQGLAILKQAMEQNPKDPEVQFFVFKAHKDLGHQAEAQAAARKVLELSPGTPMAAQAEEFLGAKPAEGGSPSPAAAASGAPK